MSQNDMLAATEAMTKPQAEINQKLDKECNKKLRELDQKLDEHD